MTMIGQAGPEETRPVLLLHASAGFPFGLRTDASVLVHDVALDLPEDRAATDLLVFTSLDAATAFACGPRGAQHEPPDHALVIVDNWAGHDHALRNFTLLFVQHRLIAAGARHIRFLVTTGDRPPEGWHADLDVTEGNLPLSAVARPARGGAVRPALGLLLDQATTDEGVIDWAGRLHRDRQMRIFVIAGPDGPGGASLPTTFHRIDDAAAVWPWLGRRLDLLAGYGLQGWQKRFVGMAQENGLRTADIATPAGRTNAARLLETSGSAGGATEPTGQPQSPGDWLRQAAGLSGQVRS